MTARRSPGCGLAGQGATSRVPELGQAPELLGVHPWLNTAGAEPLSLDELRGRVVLVEFWTFACGNCQRTVPFLRRMHERYQPGFTVVGVHTPEFEFERSVLNVERAVHEQAIEYPIGLDNDDAAWNAYGNRYWPTIYLLDRTGKVRYTQIGEGTTSALRARSERCSANQRSRRARRSR